MALPPVCDAESEHLSLTRVRGASSTSLSPSGPTNVDPTITLSNLADRTDADVRGVKGGMAPSSSSSQVRPSHVLELEHGLRRQL